jgi:transcription elongation factor GreA
MTEARPGIADKIEALKGEIAALEREAREEIPAQMESARDVGPVRENADMYLVAGRAHYVQGRLASLRQRLQALQKLDLSSLPRDRAAYGSRLVLEDLDGGPDKGVLLVTPEETGENPEGVSLLSPLGRALSGRRAGDEIEVATPAGHRLYRIRSLRTLFEQEQG